MDKALTRRQKKLLRWIINRFIESANPVGSDQLVKKCHLDCSPATVRNEMVGLEKLGYVKQPHTSAGRIPTDKGYRFYVDSLMRRTGLKREEIEHIRGSFQNERGNVRIILENASKMLSTISQELGIILTPWVSQDIFDRLEFIKLSSKKVLVVIHVINRLVKTVVLTLDIEMTQRELEEAASAINERISGLTIIKIRSSVKERIKELMRKKPHLIGQFLKASSDLFDFSNPVEIHAYGTNQILSQPEFSNRDMLNSILTLIEDRNRLIHLFRQNAEKMEVRIGHENYDHRLKSFSVVTAKYRMGRDIGAIGVIGPTRMRYYKILPLVEHIADTISVYLS